MESNAQHFVLTFVPLFIVIDALGILPFVISMSEDMSKRERRKMIHVATATAAIAGIVFLFRATQFPIYMVLLSFTLNMLIAWVVFMVGKQLAHFFGRGGLQAASRVFSLLLAAIAATMIVRGLEMLSILTT